MYKLITLLLLAVPTSCIPDNAIIPNSRSHHIHNRPIIHKYWSAKLCSGVLIVGYRCKKQKGIIRAEIMDGQVLRISKERRGVFGPPYPLVPQPLNVCECICVSVCVCVCVSVCMYVNVYAYAYMFMHMH